MFTRLRVWVGMVVVVNGAVLGVSWPVDGPLVVDLLRESGPPLSYGLLGMNEDLAKERFEPPVKGADAVALRFVRLTGSAHLLIGALDTGRWHYAPWPRAIRGAALAGMALGDGDDLPRHAREPIFLRRGSSAVGSRPSRDRDRAVPLIRHPGYAGMVAAIPFSGLALGSWLVSVWRWCIRR